MLRFIIFLSTFGFQLLFGESSTVKSDDTLADIEEGDRRIAESNELLDRLSETQNIRDSDLEKLATVVFSFRPDYYSEDRWRADEFHQNYWKARELLLSYEGHAKYFADKITALSEDLKNDRTNWPLANGDAYLSINRLKVMPSHECVVELTKLLELQSNWFGNRFFGREQILFNGQTPDDQSASFAGMAASALYELGIDGGAPEESELQNGEIARLDDGLGADFLVDEWKKWWQEVVDGKRTFGFEGDPKRYNHLGVVEVPTSPREEIKIGKTSSYPPSFESPGASQVVEKEAVYFKWIYLFLGIAISAGIGILVRNRWKGSSVR